MKFCGEITYEMEEIGGIHSDICWNCNPNTENKNISLEQRQFLHDCLNEWLDKSNGTGAFWIGDPEYFAKWGE